MKRMTPKRFTKAKQETTSYAQEVSAHLYKALLAMKPFTLMDGTPVRVEAYSSPEINDQGEATFGVDVKLPEGHLEFTMRNSGWGKSFSDALTPKTRKVGRER